MKNDIFSNHIGNASELTVIANIKQDFVAVPQPLTFANRLRVHLRMLSALRRSGLETDRAGLYFGPIDSLRTLQFVRWTLIENDTKMLLSVNFDRAFEPYIRRIVQAAGPLLDSILCHCEDFDGHASDNGFHTFISYAQTHQVPVELFAAANPNFSVDDADYFLEFDKAFRSGQGHVGAGNWHPSLQLETPQSKRSKAIATNPIAVFEQAFRILRVMAENQWRFSRLNQNRGNTFDDYIYYRLTETLVPNFWQGLVGWAQLNKLDLRDGGTNHSDPEQRLNFVSKFPDPDTTSGLTDAQRHIAKLVKDFRTPLLWFAKRPAAPARPPIKKVDPGTIQGGMLPSNATAPPVIVPDAAIQATNACLLLFRVDDPAGGKDFLTHMSDKLWPGLPLHPENQPNGKLLYNLSVSHSGLKALNIPDADRRLFPTAFREGMARRAGLLGDVDLNHPKDWEWPVRNWPVAHEPTRTIAPSSIDIMVQIEAELTDATGIHTFDATHPLLPEISDLANQSGVELLRVEVMHRRKKVFPNQAGAQTTGHLGFVDGKSQPTYGPAGDSDKTPYGDLLLGHKDTLSGTRPYKQEKDLLRDGTFQVVRKMQVDVPAFHQHSPTDQAKMVGRNADGSTLSGGAHYVNDPDGTHCPLQSHVRRTNPVKTTPAEEATPRILRRGFSYGPFIHDPKTPDNKDRGLFFIAYNANISEQFEVIQRWITGGNSTRISSWQGDPLLAPKPPGGIRNFRYIDAKNHVISIDLPDRPIAKLQWGLYGFVPSKLGLNTLAQLAGTGAHLVTDAADLPRVMQPAETVSAEAEKQSWKRLLEDPDDAKAAQRDAIWAKVRSNNGSYDTGSTYGTLVGGADAVDAILKNTSGTYSVCEYMNRMKDSIGPQFLGLDGGAIYKKDSDAFNAFLGSMSSGTMFETALKQAKTVLAAIPVENQAELDPGTQNALTLHPLGRRCNVIAFIFQTLADLSATWFGLSKTDFQIGGDFNPKGAKPQCPMDFLASSFYVFGPHPTNNVTDFAKQRSPKAVKTIENSVAGKEPANDLMDSLLAQRDPSYWDAEKIAQMVAGGVFGFVGPVSGSLRSVLYDWIKEGTLWRLQQRFNDAVPHSADLHQAAYKILRPAILSSMGKRPIPDLIYRTKKSADAADKRVVISLKSAIDETHEDASSIESYLFGGASNTKTTPGPRHECPGKMMGLTTMMACIVALLQFSQLREEGPLTLWLHE